jgi:hypothetical protein
MRDRAANLSAEIFETYKVMPRAPITSRILLRAIGRRQTLSCPRGLSSRLIVCLSMLHHSWREGRPSDCASDVVSDRNR